jgi:hypothetical protein
MVVLKLLGLWTKACSRVFNVSSNLASLVMPLHGKSATFPVSSNLALKLWIAYLVGGCTPRNIPVNDVVT